MYRCGRRLLWLVIVGGILLLPASSPGAERAGMLVVSWAADPLDDDVEGYRVYVSTDRRLFRLGPAEARRVARTETVGADARVAVVPGLAAGVLHHVAVTSYDREGNESEFSTVISGMPCLTQERETIETSSPGPALCAVHPREIAQGESRRILTLYGAGLGRATEVDFGPGVQVRWVDASGAPTMLQVMVDVDSTARLDPRDISVIDREGRRAMKPGGFEVLLDRRRADIDESGRIDGEDLEILADAFTLRRGDSRYEERLDLNSDGTIDGLDLALLVSLMATGRQEDRGPHR